LAVEVGSAAVSLSLTHTHCRGGALGKGDADLVGEGCPTRLYTGNACLTAAARSTAAGLKVDLLQ
jgi:hypothetical protein